MDDASLRGLIGVAIMDDDVASATGDNWKCTSQYEAGWAECGFDDTHWPNAVLANHLHDSGINASHLPDDLSDVFDILKPVSNWIWTKDDSDVAYCRMQLLPGN